MNMRLFLIVFMLAVSAVADNFYRLTNEVVLITCTDRYLEIDKNYQARVTFEVNQGGSPMSLSNKTVRFVVQGSDGVDMLNREAQIVDYAGVIRWEGWFTNFPPGIYEGRMWAYNTNGVAVSLLACDKYNITYSCNTCSASVAAAATVNINSGAVQVAALTVDLISIDSQSISNAGDLWIGGTLTAGGLNITGVVAVIDTGAVRKVGGEVTGGFTNRSADGFVGNGIGLTNVQAAISTATEGTGNVVTNLTAGGGVVTGQLGIVSSGAGGTLQWYTNAYGAHFTNSAGNIEWLEGPYMGGAPSYFQDFDEQPASISNRNAATWVNYVTNGSLVIVVPNETTGLRQYDYKTVTSGTWWRAAAKINGFPIRTTATGSGQTQAGLSVHLHNGSNMMWGISCSAAQPSYRLANFSSAFNAAGTPYGVAPYDPTGTPMVPDRSPNNQEWLLMDHDGTSVWRCFTARGVHAPEMALLVTNIGWTVQAIALGVQSASAGSGRSTNSFYEIDSWQYQEGALWLPATTP